MNENGDIFLDDLDDDLDLVDMVAEIDFVAHIQPIEQEVHVHAPQLHPQSSYMVSYFFVI
jgi:hypothetical protein